MALGFSLNTRDAITTVRLTGSLTLGPQLTKLSRDISARFASRTVVGIILDLTGADAIDSAGLGELVILYTASGQAGCALCLVGIPARVKKLLELTLLADLFLQFTDEESARSWIRSR